MNLVIVESPAKAKTIEKYLGHDYKVLASFGHVRDLPTKKIGVDVKDNFKPTYEIPAKARKTIKALKEAMAKADQIYLATDYDREGEAIGWHIVQALKPKQKPQRITFTEITKPAILDAVKHPREIDLHLVDAQQARRVLDRLVGYKLSPFLWRKITQGLSAGRVQSVALRLIVEREREIEAFKKDEYWSIEADLSDGKSMFKALLAEKDGKKIGKLDIKSEKDAKAILDELKNASYKVEDVATSDKKRYPAPPFMTSTLQQDAAAKLGFSTKQTMRAAQSLYEDGLITYMRTDSLNIAPVAAKAAAEALTQEFGEKYALTTPRFFKTKSRGAQEAHEAIRPTNPSVKSDKISDRPQARLYDLIRKRFLASQAADAEIEETAAKISANKYNFNATGSKIVFDGFLKIYNSARISAERSSYGVNDDNQKTQKLPELKKGDELKLEKLEKIQHFTEPPARYSEGTLVKELEKRGIGRPSTYAPTISTIIDRGYVEKVEARLTPLDIGLRVNDLLVEHFPQIVDFDFTAKMEEELDEVAEGKIAWQPVIKEFYEPFAQILKEKMETVEKNNIIEETDEKCPDCGKNLIIKLGRFGKFYACGGYPDCKFTKPFLDESQRAQQEKIEAGLKDEKCPKCGGPMVLKEARFGPFLACSKYPECKSTKNITIAADVPCPNCGEKLLQRRTRKGKIFWGCSGYPKCKTAFWDEPTSEKCPTCGSMMVKSKTGKLKCSVCK